MNTLVDNFSEIEHVTIERVNNFHGTSESINSNSHRYYTRFTSSIVHPKYGTYKPMHLTGM